MTREEIEAEVKTMIPADLDVSTKDDGFSLQVVIAGPTAPKHRMALHFAGFMATDSKAMTEWESPLMTMQGTNFDRIRDALKNAKFKS